MSSCQEEVYFCRRIRHCQPPKHCSDGLNTGAAAGWRTEQKAGLGISGFTSDHPWTQYLSFGEMAIPIRTHPNQNTSVSGAWGLTTENQNLENVLPLCCTPISSGWKHHEDIKGIRSAIHNVFT